MNIDNVIYLKVKGNGNDSELLKPDNRIKKLSQGGIFICNQGEGKIALNDQTFLLNKNSMIVYFPFSSLKIMYRSEDLDGIVMAIDLDGVQPLLNKITDIDSVLHIRQNPFANLSEQDILRIYDYIHLYEKHLELSQIYAVDNKRRYWQLNNIQLENIKTNLILQIFLVYLPKDSTPKNTINRKDEIVMKFLSDQKHYVKQHEVGFYSNLQCISMRYFTSVVKEKSGKTPSEWITAALINDAKQFLANSNLTVKEIAETLNFPNQSYFGKWFKNNLKMGPLEYKKNINSN